MDHASQDIWKPIPGYNGAYEISEKGAVRSYSLRGCRAKSEEYPRIMKSFILSGYPAVSLCRNGKYKLLLRHRLLLLSFVGPPPDKHEAAHLDGDKMNCTLNNLRWVSHKENMSHKEVHGTSYRGSKHSRASITELCVKSIRERLNSGESIESISDYYGVSKKTVYHIKCGLTWSWLKS
jgi:hypothetical protein